MNDGQRGVDKSATTPESQAGANGVPSTLATKSSKWWWDVKIEGRKLGTMWGFIAILGMVLISLISPRATTKNTFMVILRLLIPVVLMVFYARNGYQNIRSAGDFMTLRRVRLGQLADSLYFLGFLWTLWALIDSFVIHKMEIAEMIFRAFGYALVTTATGMFLRLLLLQFLYSSEEQVLGGERTVEDDILKFSNAVTRAVKSINDFHTQTDTALTGWIASLNSSTGALKKDVENITKQTTDLNDALEKVHKVSADNLDLRITTAINQFIQKVQPSLDVLIKANVQFVTEVNTGTTTIKRQLDSSAAIVETTVHTGVKNIETVVQAGAKQIQSELSRGASMARAILEKRAETIDSAIGAFVTKFSTQIISLESNLMNLSKQIQEIRVPADIVEKAVTQQVTSATAILLGSTRAFQDAIERAAVNVSATLSTQMANLESSIVNVSKQIQEIRVPADIAEKIVERQVSMVTTSMLTSFREMQTAINMLTRSVLTMVESVPQKRRPWWRRL